MKNVVLMCRVSSDEQAKGYSLDVQFEQLSNYCLKNNLNIVKVYREDHSAKNFNRPEFQKFLQYLKKNKNEVDTLLVTSWDRFSRNMTDSLVMFRTLEEFGVSVFAIEQPIDMSIPENKAMMAFYLAIPEIDNDRRSIKIKGGIRAALKAGRWSRKAPIGYLNSRDENNKPIVVKGEKAKYILKAFEDFRDGKLQSDIIRDLKKKNVIIKRSNLSNLLRNPFYMGKIIVPQQGDESMQIIEGIHEPIVSEKLFYEVQNKFSERYSKKATGYEFQREDFPLKGLLYCTNCSELLTASKSRSANGKRYAYYHCNHCAKNRFRADLVNGHVEAILDEFQFKPEILDLYDEMMKEILYKQVEGSVKEKKAIEKNIKEVDTRIQRLQDLYIDGDIKKDQYKETMKRYENERTKLTGQHQTFQELDFEYKKWRKHGVNAFLELSKFYKTSSIKSKQTVISSIFPEKLYFDGEKCRTQRVNEVLLNTILINSGLCKNKKGQKAKKSNLSSLVGRAGFEPAKT